MNSSNIYNSGTQVGIGTASPSGTLEVVGNSTNGITISNYAQTNFLIMRRAQGTIGSPTQIGANGIIGRIFGQGYTGTSFKDAASIHFEAESAPITSSSPGNIVFSTTPVGSTSVSERFRINSNGALGVAGANYGSSGQVLTSSGSTGSPSWLTPTTGSVTSVGTGVSSVTGLTGGPITTTGTLSYTGYGNNIQSVKGTTNTTVASTTFADVSQMTITFTPRHSTVYVSCGLNATAPTTSQQWLGLGINVGGTVVAQQFGILTDYDDVFGGTTGGGVCISDFPVTVTIGTPVTIKLQWRTGGLGAGTATNNAATASSYFRNLTILD